MITYRALALTLAIVSGSSMAASFDCSKATGFAETQICKDGYLSGVDSILSRSYKKTLDSASDPDALRQSQREWLIVRDACTTQKCLDTTLGARVKFLENYVRDESRNAFTEEQQRLSAKRQAEQAQRDQEAEHSRTTQERERQQILVEPARQTQTASSTPPSYAPEALTTVTKQGKSFWKKLTEGPAWKYVCLIGFFLSCWAVWRHHKGTTTIYNNYTDAAISNGIPLAGFIIAGVCRWLELPGEMIWVAAGTGLILAGAYASYASVRVNQGGLSITLSIITKLLFIGVFYAVIGMLVASLFVGTKFKGESQARANARNRREKKQTLAQIAALSAGYTALTIWLCRRPEFTSISECLDFELTPQPA